MEKFINGTTQVLHIKQDGFYFPIGCLVGNSFEESVDTIPTTTRENLNGWESSRPTNQRYSISFSGLVLSDRFDATVITYEQIRILKRQRILIEWKISREPNNDDYGFGYITSLGDSSNIDEFVSFTGEIMGQGVPENFFDAIYFGYKDRVEADGGTLTSEACTKLYIDKLLNS
jgi:hypothetical protein